MKKLETNKNVEAIRQAILDYVEGAYTVDPARIERSVHPKLAKLGFIQEETGYAEHPMTFEELVEIVKTFNQDGHVPQDAPKNITIYEVLEEEIDKKIERIKKEKGKKLAEAKASAVRRNKLLEVIQTKKEETKARLGRLAKVEEKLKSESKKPKAKKTKAKTKKSKDEK